MTSLLLCTDLDRTLLPNGAQPESPQARPLFRRVVAQPGVVLAYVSGRDRGLVEEAIATYDLPQPHYIVSDVGTTIYERVEGQDSPVWHLWPHWHTEIAPDWQGFEQPQLQDWLADLTPPLHLQAPERQNRFKLSYTVALEVDKTEIDHQVRDRLDRQGIQASRVWSVDEAAGVGLLDVLPKRATKLHAVEFLQRTLNLNPCDVLFAGDSGNDLPVLASAIPAVLVANARSEVAAEAIAQAESQGHQDQLYLASGNFAGMNGHYSAGILEGLAHFHPHWIKGMLNALVEWSEKES